MDNLVLLISLDLYRETRRIDRKDQIQQSIDICQSGRPGKLAEVCVTSSHKGWLLTYNCIIFAQFAFEVCWLCLSRYFRLAVSAPRDGDCDDGHRLREQQPRQMSLSRRVPRPGGFAFPGWGRAASIAVVKTAGGELASADEIAAGAVAPDAPPSHGPPHASLGQFTATSIAGNDLLSSCLYTAGACAKYAGKLAPFSLALVGFMLYFFRFVYSEVVTAMPVNGGSYNALLNTTSKRFAAMAACLSLISYVATAVVSGCYAMIYLKSVWLSLDVHGGTIVVLGAFALLTLIGVGESAVVATGMFFLHVFALLLLCAWCLVATIKNNFSVLSANWDSPYPTITTTTGGFIAEGSAPGALFFGYAAALLGITGFETAANYVEEMRDSSVYVSTLRNMWWAAALFNPIISLLVMGVVPMNSILDPTQSNKLLCVAAQAAADITHPDSPGVGKAFSGFIAVDATVVLAGSVLTAYVGVTGLVRRLALDRCLPELLMTVNKLRGTAHWTIIGFFALTSTLFLVLYPPSARDTSGVDQLGNVYDLAFLSVMSMFAVSAFILKWKRPDLPRRVITRTGTVATALVCVLAGLAGNIVEGPGTLPYFILYVGAIAAVVFAMFQRASILKFVYKVAGRLLASKGERSVAKAREDALVEAHRKTEETRLAVAHAAAVRASVRITSSTVPTHDSSSINGSALPTSAASASAAASPLMRTGATSAAIVAGDAALALLTPSPSSSLDGATPDARALLHLEPRGSPPTGESAAASASDDALDDGVVGLPATPSALLAAASAASTPRLRDASGGASAASALAGGRGGAYSALPASEDAADAAATSSSPAGSSAARFFGFGASSSSAAVPSKRVSSVGVALGPVAAVPSAPPAAALRGRLATEDDHDADGDPDGFADDPDDGDEILSSYGAGVGEEDGPDYDYATAPGSPVFPSAGVASGTGTSTGTGGAVWASASSGAGATAPAPGSVSVVQGAGLRRRRLQNSSSYFARAGTGASVTSGVALAVASQAGVPAGSFRNVLGDVRPAPGATGGAAQAGAASAGGVGVGHGRRGSGSSLNAPLLSASHDAASLASAAGGVRPAAALAQRGGSAWKRRVSGWLASQIRSINGQQVVYFAKRPDLVSLNKAVQYVRDNELTSRLVVVHVVDDREAVQRLIAEAAAALASENSSLVHGLAADEAAGAGAPANGGLAGGIQLADMSLSRGSSFVKREGDASAHDASAGPSGSGTANAGAGAGAGAGTASTLALRLGSSSAPVLSFLDRLPPPGVEVVQLQHNCALLDAVYPKLRIDCLVVRGSFFSPAVVSFLARYLRVTPNLMFMAMPDARFPHQFAALGGVRVITRTAKKGERAAAARHLQRVLAEIRAHQAQAAHTAGAAARALAAGDAAAAVV